MLTAAPELRAISFTGSTVTGHRIVRVAGLKKFSMELGGKSPVILGEDADLALRPKSLDEFVGQQGARENLRIFVNAARFIALERLICPPEPMPSRPWPST